MSIELHPKVSESVKVNNVRKKKSKASKKIQEEKRVQTPSEKPLTSPAALKLTSPVILNNRVTIYPSSSSSAPKLESGSSEGHYRKGL